MNDIRLEERNQRLAGRVVNLLRTNPGSSLFFAFGAAHFTGDDSVIDLVREAGFEVERVRVSDDLRAWQSPDNAGAQRRDLSFLLIAVLTFLSLNISIV